MIRFLLASTLALAPTAAFAHGLHAAGGGLVAGFVHPLLGLDHLLAMVAVGLWATQSGAAPGGGRAIWLVPLSFMGAMAVGGALALSGVVLPAVEPGVLGSVLILGAVVALAPRLPVEVPMLVVGLFALAHGHAHGTEMPATAAPALYALGFLAATGALHALGVLVGRCGPALLRVAGAAIALGGVALALA
jgi:urease accessory protein